MNLKLVNQEIWDTDTMTKVSYQGHWLSGGYGGYTILKAAKSEMLKSIFDIYEEDLKKKEDISFIEADKYSFSIVNNYTKQTKHRPLTPFKRDEYTYEIYDERFSKVYTLIYKKGGWMLEGYGMYMYTYITYLSDILVVAKLIEELNNQVRPFKQRLKDLFHG